MSSTSPPTRSGRHAGGSVSRFDPATTALLGAVLAVVVFVGIGLFTLLRGDGNEPAGQTDGDNTTSNAADLPESCDSVIELDVAVPPELAPIVEAAGEPVAADCVQVTLREQRPTQVAADIQEGEAPDVWVSDAADWTSRITEHRSDQGTFRITSLTTAEEPSTLETAAGWSLLGSVATSPIVLAVGPAPAEENTVTPETTWREMFTTTRQIRLAQPSTDAASRLALDLARGAVPAQGDDYLLLGQRMIFLSRFATDTDEASFEAEDVGAGDVVPFPVSEQRLASYIKENPESTLQPVIPADGTAEFTYPMYVQAELERTERDAALALFQALRSPELLDLQREAGFRTPGDPGPQINGVDAVPYRLAALPATDRAIETTRLWDTLRIDSRMLTTIDVSGSMLWAAGNTTRLELMQGALLNALGVLPDGSQIGSWVFSTDRASGQDWEPTVPVRALNEEVDGQTQREVLAQHVNELETYISGDTGLYDTALAAYLDMQSNYDPAHVNSVVIVTDGINDDPGGGLTLDQLLAQLAENADPMRPVRIITIGIGPDTDPAALEAIAQATGGTSYVAVDPGDIELVFFRALLARAA
ncbi:MAG: VWA domain-containing protein [Actinomycetales bacterium]|nr:substrate-binding domain-containing protein [Tetrasphaera sp.]NLW98583.1 VWA domain-containing protein [Actinomycetales bacterium]